MINMHDMGIGITWASWEQK